MYSDIQKYSDALWSVEGSYLKRNLPSLHCTICNEIHILYSTVQKHVYVKDSINISYTGSCKRFSMLNNNYYLEMTENVVSAVLDRCLLSVIQNFRAFLDSHIVWIQYKMLLKSNTVCYLLLEKKC